MNRLVAALTSLLVVSSLAARDLRPEVEVSGRVKQIGLSHAGDLWIVTAMGNAYRSDDGGTSWTEIATPARKVDYAKKLFLGDHLDRITFFDARRAMISGYIGENTDSIFLTEDGGTTWKASVLPVSMWVYDAQATADGHAWLVGSDGDVLRSDDYGVTWKRLARPFDESERTLSVWFASTEVGAVSTIFDGTVAMTIDGGATWMPFVATNRESVVSGCGTERPDLRINKVRLTEDRVIITQCGGVFSASLTEPRSWSPVMAGGKAVIDFELGENGALIVAGDDGRIYEIPARGGSRFLGAPLARAPIAIGVSGKRIALVDSTDKVAAFDGTKWFSSRMFGKGTATSWPIGRVDRGADDVLWGVTQFFLYRSTDAAKTWDRIAELPAMADGIALQDDGNVLVWDGHGWVGRWDVAAARFVDVPVLNGLDIVGSFRRRDLWLLFGGRQYDTVGRVEIAQTFFSGQFSGSIDYGFVAASVDGGRTWRVIDKWDEGPQALFLSDDGRLTLLSWLCGIRQGTLTTKPLHAEMKTVLRGDEREKTPYVQRTYVLDLLDPANGFLLGWIHHIDNVLHRTRDGGRTWKPAPLDEYPHTALQRMFDGTWVVAVPPASLERWNGKRFEHFATLPRDVQSISVDSRGSLLVGLGDRTYRVLDAGEKQARALKSVDAVDESHP